MQEAFILLCLCGLEVPDGKKTVLILYHLFIWFIHSCPSAMCQLLNFCIDYSSEIHLMSFSCSVLCTCISYQIGIINNTKCVLLTKRIMSKCLTQLYVHSKSLFLTKCKNACCMKKILFKYNFKKKKYCLQTISKFTMFKCSFFVI